MFGISRIGVIIMCITFIAQSNLATSKRVSIFRIPDYIENEIEKSTTTGDVEENDKQEEKPIELTSDPILMQSEPDQAALNELADEILTFVAEENEEEFFGQFIDQTKPPTTFWDYIKELGYGLYSIIHDFFMKRR